MIRVSQLFVYPIKSCRGIAVESARVLPRGLEYDRRYMLVDAQGRFLTQRRYPQMALIETAFADAGFTVTAPGREPLQLPFLLDDPALESCQAKVWADTLEATLADTATNVWFSEVMGFACGLVCLAEHQHRPVTNEAAAFDDEVSFADGAPLLLISQAALDGLNERLEQPVSIANFRPNIVVEGCEAHAEDDWSSLTIGDTRLQVGWACSRCVLTTVNPETGEKDAGNEPMRTLGEYRRRDRAVYFGQNLLPRQLGTISVGDQCVIDQEESV